MTTEEKAKAYDEAIERAKEYLTLKEAKEYIFPELAESEDERIRTRLIALVEAFGQGTYKNEMLAYLEKQKEQNPAEWSEEFLRLMGITISQDGNQVCVLLGENLAEGIAGFGDTLADAVEEFKKEWRQFDRFRKATWKPSKKQMLALEWKINNTPVGAWQRKELESIHKELNRL